MVNRVEYAATARAVAAQGCVLLKNDNQALPLKKQAKVAVFGINAFHYYKSGLGSGGMVNTEYVVSVLDALKAEQNLTVDETLLQVYEDWIAKNPFDEGHGWGTTPWSQEEMPLTEEIVAQAKERNDIAVIMIGRTAGEDQDNTKEEKSYLLSKKEREMLQLVCSTFEKTVVLLNVGNIIDMKWVAEYNPSAVMYIWQGGQEGGNGVLDVLTGKVSPCGKLTDTIAQNVEDYPSDAQFGDSDKNFYEEDIYVGYRYFSSTENTRKKVLYPFGFGLSYTDFTIAGKLKAIEENQVVVEATVKNTGDCAGKEVVQVYVEAPQGKMDKPLRVLAGFAKTKELAPLEEETLQIVCPKTYFASFDENGKTGYASSFVLEEGTYQIYVGANVEEAKLAGSWNNSFEVIETCTSACTPIDSFERLHLQETETGYQFTKELLQGKPYETGKEICDFEEIPQDFTESYQLKQVLEGEISLERFLAQLTDDDLMHMVRGEGMCSMKVTPGTAGAFGGLTPHLKELGIPALCCADGPSGIRMDCGTEAFSLPNGTLIGSTFDEALTEKLFDFVGEELRDNKIDTLLGPGINIHRHPLNGRNFEYISEDPLLTGKICAAQLKAMHKYGVTGTIKHFCANNQEKYRLQVEAVVSERALREVYLRGYEIAVKEGNARSVMTTYGPVNGLWTAGSYDLCTNILRRDWGYKGIVMTDWWAVSNWYGEKPDKGIHAPMVMAQNDIFMLCQDTVAENEIDDLKKELKAGRITRAMLQRNVKNILQFALQSPALERMIKKQEGTSQVGEGTQEQVSLDDFACFTFPQDFEPLEIKLSEHPQMLNKNGILFGLTLQDKYKYDIAVTYRTQSGELAQIPVSVYISNTYQGTHSLRGTNGEVCTYKSHIDGFTGPNHFIKLVYKPNELDLISITFSLRNEEVIE
ncbi:MAG: glycoside hydrolase family 3 C-terminal domain-containing protein [Eubacterium sp.]|nr:glycoside hydrolase family 3 C-terminal domain-containing protein [Eubacterium sp.]